MHVSIIVTVRNWKRFNHCVACRGWILTECDLIDWAGGFLRHYSLKLLLPWLVCSTPRIHLLLTASSFARRSVLAHWHLLCHRCWSCWCPTLLRPLCTRLHPRSQPLVKSRESNSGCDHHSSRGFTLRPTSWPSLFKPQVRSRCLDGPQTQFSSERAWPFWTRQQATGGVFLREWWTLFWLYHVCNC